LLAVAAAGPLLSEESHRQAFQEHKERYDKTYAAHEEAERFAAFKENRVFVQRYNAESRGAQLALNEFADLRPADFAQHYLGYVPRAPGARWGGAAFLGLHAYSGTALPDEVDWTAKGAVTPVKNQGQCGSCWSFSATGALEGAWQVATGKLVSLSEQQLIDCSGAYGNNACSGGLMDDAFAYMEKSGSGMCTEESYRYAAAKGTCGAAACTVGVPSGHVTGYRDVAPDDEAALQEAVAKGPVSVAIEADQSVFQLYSSGVLTSAGCGTALDHGVLVVGYGTLDGQKYWKVKNSWGPSWGQEGYILLARGNSTYGECGILKQPSYPVVAPALDTLGDAAMVDVAQYLQDMFI